MISFNEELHSEKYCVTFVSGNLVFFLEKQSHLCLCFPVNFATFFRTTFSQNMITMKLISSKLLKNMLKPLLKRKPSSNIIFIHLKHNSRKLSRFYQCYLYFHKNFFRTIEDSCIDALTMQLGSNRLHALE